MAENAPLNNIPNRNNRKSFNCFSSWHLPQMWYQRSSSSRLYDKRDNYNFAIINCPHLVSSISTDAAYGVYILQLECYAGFLRIFKQSSHLIKNFFGRYQYLVEKYFVTYAQMMKDGIGNYILIQSDRLYYLMFNWCLRPPSLFDRTILNMWPLLCHED